MTTPAERYVTLDVIRGFAVMGILVMNIVGMGMPAYAYIDPTYYGGATGADLWAWALAYALADGKMRMLFTMLFGASLAVITDRAEHPAATHYSRMFWLFVFGMLHAWFVWYGDILTEYAVVGALLFFVRRWPPAALFTAAAAFLLFQLGTSLLALQQDAALRIAAEAHGATEAARAAWADRLAQLAPPPGTIAAELAGYRGGIADAFVARAPMTLVMQTILLPVSLPETLAFAAAGLGLYRTGFLTGAWRAATYRTLVGAAGLALIAYIPLIQWIVRVDWSHQALTLADQISLILRPFVALGYASALILLVQSGALARLVGRMAAAGRMAFSNYLGTSLVATTIFNGYGLGLYGHLGRAQLYWVVLLIWVLMLAWSKPWLAHYHYGPLEWLWRSLARGELQPMRR